MLLSFSVLWRSLIIQSNGILTSAVDITSLAKVTDGYTQKHLVTACTQVLTERRVSQLAKRPLVASEFIPPLARIDPIYKEEEEAFKVITNIFLANMTALTPLWSRNSHRHWRINSQAPCHKLSKLTKIA